MFDTLNSIKISTKLPIAIGIAALLVGLGTGISGYLIGASAISKQSADKLSALAVTRVHEIERSLHRIETDLKLYAEDPAFIEAITDFSSGFNQLGLTAGDVLRDAYIFDNPNEAGQKDRLDRAAGENAYNVAHAHFHPYLRDLVHEKKYYDLFLFDTDGDLIYSMYKELDFAENFGTNGGQYADTGLGEVFRHAMDESVGAISFVDFAPYAPSNGAPAAFMATKVVNEAGRPIGVVALQMPVGAINDLFFERAGLGETGETILVGEDGLLRVDSRFSEGDDMLSTRFDAHALEAALQSDGYQGHIESYRNTAFEVTVLPFGFEGVHWAVAALQASDEVNAPLATMRNLMALIGVLMTAITALIGFFFSRNITNGIAALTGTMSDLASGRLDVSIPGEDRGDELGAMARAVDVFKQNGVARERLENQSEAEQAERANRQKRIEDMISQFRDTVAGALAAVGQNSGVMDKNADQLSGIADNTSRQTDEAMDASRTAAENVQAVAAAAEELAASIEEISQQVARTNTIVNQATNAANMTNEKVVGLAAAARKIGDVISLIQDIAEQTNLLALNTSIEAARAGEAGKGFAVVASEVKSLANQTATATEEISAQIANIQSSTEDAVKAIEDIATTMAEVNNYTASIASAVEEQGSATAEISQSVTHAARGTERVVDSLNTVTDAVGHTRKSASDVLTASRDVGQQTKLLKETVDRFLADVSAA